MRQYPIKVLPTCTQHKYVDIGVLTLIDRDSRVLRVPDSGFPWTPSGILYVEELPETNSHFTSEEIWWLQ